MTLPSDTPSADRRIDLDWLRIGAFGLLILYHIGMFYVTWGWHVKSAHASSTIEPLMMLVNPWRLHILFLISGVATRFMADKVSARSLGVSRLHRLWWPLLFGVLVIVPPQAYYEVLSIAAKNGGGAQVGFTGNWFDFYGKYITGYDRFCDGGECLIVPTWNHMWFVAYLLVYSLVLCLFLPVLRRVDWRFAKPFATGWWFLVLPFLFLWLTRATLFPAFGDTHALIGDWYLHVMYGGLFLLGFAIGKWDAPFETARRWRWPALMVALLAFGGVLAINATWGQATSSPQHQVSASGMRSLQAWAAIVALLGFARHHIHADTAARRYLTEAIFPFYIIHQTVIVIAGFHLDKLRTPLWFEAPVLIAITAAACFAGFEVVRRVPVLRPVFGLRGAIGSVASTRGTPLRDDPDGPMS